MLLRQSQKPELTRVLPRRRQSQKLELTRVLLRQSRKQERRVGAERAMAALRRLGPVRTPSQVLQLLMSGGRILLLLAAGPQRWR